MKNTMIRLLSLTVAALTLILSLPLSAAALSPVITSGLTGECFWNYDEASKTLLIDGYGPMQDYEYVSDTPWNYLTVESIVIEEGVTAIGSEAFAYTNARSVSISDSVTSIGAYAFRCSDLESVTIPGGVQSVGECAFYFCDRLRTVTVSEGVSRIGDEAFWYCDNINTVSLPETLSYIGEGAFAHTYNAAVSYAGTPSGWKAIAGDGVDEISAKNTLTCAKKDPLLATPRVTASNTTAGVKIAWGKVDGAAKYRVFRKSGAGSWVKLTDTIGTAYTDKSVKSGTKYTYTVRCITKDGTGYTSAYDTAGKSVTYLAAPKVAKVENTASGVKITWGKVTGAAKYRIFRKTGSGGWSKLTDTIGTAYTDKKVKSGTKYTYTVRCITKDGKSYTSAYDTAGKVITYVAAPKITKLTPATGKITITWGKVAGAAKYRVFVKNGNSWKKLADTTKTSYTHTGLKAYTKYSYTVRAMNSKGAFVSAYDTAGKTVKSGAAAKTTTTARTTTSSTSSGSASSAVSGSTVGSGGTVYITNTGSKYHNSGCQHLKSSRIAVSLSWARSHGYTACKTCH